MVDGGSSESARRGYAGALLTLGAVLVVAAFAMSIARGETALDVAAPGVIAGGVELGGKPESEVTRELETLGAAIARREVALAALGREIRIVPAEVGFAIDVGATTSQVMSAGRETGLDGVLRSLNRTRTEVGLTISIDEAALAELAPSWEVSLGVELPFDGAIELQDGRPVARMPRAGKRIDRPELARRLSAELTEGKIGPVAVPFIEETPPIPEAEVEAALVRAKAILSGPITLVYEPSPEEVERAARENDEAVARAKEAQDRDKWRLPEKKKRMRQKGRRLIPEATPREKPDLSPIPSTIEVVFEKAELSSALRAIRVDAPSPHFVVELDEGEVKKKLAPFVARLFDPARDARFDIAADGSITIVPSRPGTRVDTTRLVEALYAASAAEGRRGELPVDREAQPKFTTEAAKSLGIRGLVAEFTTHHPCCQPRVKNIHRIADMLDGTIVKPGETFSVNAAIGPRTLERGFMLAPSIGDGEMVDTPGGGVSQFATTLYNALFNGGYAVKERQPHSYYFNRYPMGIEATLSFPKPDLVFYNDTEAAVLVRCDYSDTFIRVKLFGDNGGRKIDRKVSQPFDYTDPKIEYEPNDRRDPEKEKVRESGSMGFSVVTARVLTASDGTKREEKRTVVYRARPRVIEVHPCKIPKNEKGHTGEKCPEPEGEGGGAPTPEGEP